MVGLTHKIIKMPAAEEALAGREQAIEVAASHYVNGHAMQPPFPETMQLAMFGLGCFWGAERLFWTLPGVYSTAVGYAAGYTPNPTYEEVCTGKTGHNEVVLVVYDPSLVSYADLLKVFWEGHNPCQGMQQGNDVGTQYRSGIYTFSDPQAQLAASSRDGYGALLSVEGYSEVTTEVIEAPEFYYAEHYHQQYLAKQPNGYCGLGGTGIGYTG